MKLGRVMSVRRTVMKLGRVMSVRFGSVPGRAAAARARVW